MPRRSIGVDLLIKYNRFRLEACGRRVGGLWLCLADLELGLLEILLFLLLFLST